MADTPHYLIKAVAEGEDYNYKAHLTNAEIVSVSDDGEALVTSADYETMKELLYKSEDISAREIIVNPSLSEVAGERYQSIPAALVYTATQGPEYANQFLLRVQGLHTITEATGRITCQPWVHMIGDADSEIYCNDPGIVSFYTNPLIVLASNCWIKDMYAHGGPSPENTVLWGTINTIANCVLDGCVGLIDPATIPNAEGDQACLSVRTDNGTLSGTVKDCTFTCANHAVRIQTNGLLVVKGLTATSVRQQKSEGSSGISAVNGKTGGLIVIRDSTIIAYGDDANGSESEALAPVYGVNGGAGIGGGSSIVRIFDSSIKAVHTGTGDSMGVHVVGASSAFAHLNKAIALETYNCEIECVAASGESDGVYVSNAASKLLVDGGEIKASGAGTIYDAKRVTSGSLTLDNVISEGRFSGTMTHGTTSKVTADSIEIAQLAAMNYAETSAHSVYALFTAQGADEDDTRIIEIQFKDADGNDIGKNVAFHVWEATARMGVISNSLDTLSPVTGHGKLLAALVANQCLLVLSDADGNAQLTVAKAATDLHAYIHVEIPATGQIDYYDLRLGSTD